MIERTFVMIKPDGVGRRLVGEVIRRYEAKGLNLIGLKMRLVSREAAKRHYADHEGRPYYEGLLSFLTSNPVIQMVWEGENAIAVARRLNGATNSWEADLGTIRGDLAMATRYNIVHASDSLETAQREITLYFEEAELATYTMPDQHWLRG